MLRSESGALAAKPEPNVSEDESPGAGQREPDTSPDLGPPISVVDVSPAAGAPAPSTLGRVGRYELLVELASGGMATVLLARNAESGGDVSRLVAVKRPHPHLAKDPAYTSMLLDEARLASAIRHPNVVRVRELGFENDPEGRRHAFIVMDYVEGASLVELRRELADAGRALDAPIAVRIVTDALAGLHAAHTLKDNTGHPLGIIHRDVSPHNVLLGTDGAARLTDFGIAKADDRVQVTRTHEVKGKLSYMAPERVDRRRICTVQSDVFSMAVVLWESLAGRRLFKGDEPAVVLEAVLGAPIPKLRTVGATHVSDALDDVIARALSRDLGVRFANAEDFRVALLHAARGGVASHEDVARVVETVFSSRLRVLQESVRRVLGDSATERLFVASGLRLRPRPTPSMPLSTPELLGGIGAEAPSGRYLVEPGEAGPSSIRASRGRRVALLATGGAAVAIGLLAVGAFALSRGPSIPGASTGASSSVADAALGAPLSRSVRVELPFAASRVALDADERALAPPNAVAIFDVPLDRPTVHRVVAVADDGASAEGTVAEANGLVVVDGPGVRVVRPAPSALPSARAPRGKDEVGTRRNGFTKLK